MFVLWTSGREARRLCGWPGGREAYWSGEEKEQSWGGRQAFSGTVIIYTVYCLKKLELSDYYYYIAIIKYSV